VNDEATSLTAPRGPGVRALRSPVKWLGNRRQDGPARTQSDPKPKPAEGVLGPLSAGFAIPYVEAPSRG
jgi:hypothetical protein